MSWLPACAHDNGLFLVYDASPLEVSTGRRWIKTHQPELYGPLAVPTDQDEDPCQGSRHPQ